MADIKFFIMDVDGTLTDGKIYMGQNGELAKAFDIKDGCGILLELPLYGINPVIITARESAIVRNRCKELKIIELHQGVKDKLGKLHEVIKKYGASIGSVAYAGDDLPDIPCMEEVKKDGGLVLCPADAIPEIKALANYVSVYKAGDGAIRDMIRYLGGRRLIRNVHEEIDEALTWMLSSDFSAMNAGMYQRDDGTTYSIQEYTTKKEDECLLESHRNHIEIQLMIQGKEILKTYTTSCLTSVGKYNEEKDSDYWGNGLMASQSVLIPGSIIVVINGQPHKSAISFLKPEKVKKVVYKIEV